MPDSEYINGKFQTFLQEMKMKFNFDTEFFEGLFESESPVGDVEMDYNVPGVGNMKFTVFDSKFFIDGVTFFRPFIRGFIVLLMGLYNVRMVLSFIRQDAGVVAGKMDGGKEK